MGEKPMNREMRGIKLRSMVRWKQMSMIRGFAGTHSLLWAKSWTRVMHGCRARLRRISAWNLAFIVSDLMRSRICMERQEWKKRKIISAIFRKCPTARTKQKRFHGITRPVAAGSKNRRPNTTPQPRVASWQACTSLVGQKRLDWRHACQLRRKSKARKNLAVRCALMSLLWAIWVINKQTLSKLKKRMMKKKADIWYIARGRKENILRINHMRTQKNGWPKI